MFWKKKSTDTVEPKPKAEKPAETPAAAQPQKEYKPPTRAEIQGRMEALTLTQPMEVFYLARSTKSGGPLGKGAEVVELNPRFPAKGQKKYLVSLADVAGDSLATKDFWYGSDKAKEIADRIAEGQLIYRESA